MTSFLSPHYALTINVLLTQASFSLSLFWQTVGILCLTSFYYGQAIMVRLIVLRGTIKIPLKGTIKLHMTKWGHDVTLLYILGKIPLGKVWIQLFSLQLWVDSRVDWVLQPWLGNQSRRRKSLNLLNSAQRSSLCHILLANTYTYIPDVRGQNDIRV